MNQSIAVLLCKRYVRSFFLAICLLQLASHAYASQDVTEVRRMAVQGNAQAQNNLGSAYYLGQGVAQDYKQAFDWFQKAADQGQVNAQHNLGVLYANGKGVALDFDQAVAWYRKAAEQGYVTAQTNLGAGYYLGQGVAQDYSKALFWFRKAAEQSDARAYLYLGACYYRGNGVDVDYEEAVLWFRRAAEQAKHNSQPDIEKEAFEAARVAANAQASLDAKVMHAPVMVPSPAPSPDTKGADFMRVFLLARFKQNPMTEDQFNRYSKQPNYKQADNYSDLMVEYFQGKLPLDQVDKKQQIFLMEEKLAGEDPNNYDEDIVEGFVKNKLIKLGL